MYSQIIDKSFYIRSSEIVAQELLGKILVVETNNILISGMIVETEAYHQLEAGSHSFVGETPRNRPMFEEGGIAYVYFIYGMYYCFNVVTDRKGFGSAVLIRAIEPLQGLDEIKVNRNINNKKIENLTNGPGKVCQALGIDKTFNGLDLINSKIKLYGFSDKKELEVVKSTRIGLSKGKELEMRYYVKGNKFVSKV